jgi:hypothetical protein
MVFSRSQPYSVLANVRSRGVLLNSASDKSAYETADQDSATIAVIGDVYARNSDSDRGCDA